MGTQERTKGQAEEFAKQAEGGRSSFLGELLAYLAENKKWWLTPIVVVLLLVGVLVVLGGTAAAPFIYTLF
ncbi:MAG: hypothetical protein D6815_11200 [Candidatus Dadabacteria bacterium]|nr:MAG: hypothetical protein D6815_11200 [Candidatus Dadabacteria bacterium]